MNVARKYLRDVTRVGTIAGLGLVIHTFIFNESLSSLFFSLRDDPMNVNINNLDGMSYEQLKQVYRAHLSYALDHEIKIEGIDEERKKLGLNSRVESVGLALGALSAEKITDNDNFNKALPSILSLRES